MKSIYCEAWLSAKRDIKLHIYLLIKKVIILLKTWSNHALISIKILEETHVCHTFWIENEGNPLKNILLIKQRRLYNVITAHNLENFMHVIFIGKKDGGIHACHIYWKKRWRNSCMSYLLKKDGGIQIMHVVLGILMPALNWYTWPEYSP